jgi:hypothetical protein
LRRWIKRRRILPLLRSIQTDTGMDCANFGRHLPVPRHRCSAARPWPGRRGVATGRMGCRPTTHTRPRIPSTRPAGSRPLPRNAPRRTAPCAQEDFAGERIRLCWLPAAAYACAYALRLCFCRWSHTLVLYLDPYDSLFFNISVNTVSFQHIGVLYISFPLSV